MKSTYLSAVIYDNQRPIDLLMIRSILTCPICPIDTPNPSYYNGFPLLNTYLASLFVPIAGSGSTIV
jgi:hypothetical protein